MDSAILLTSLNEIGNLRPKKNKSLNKDNYEKINTA